MRPRNESAIVAPPGGTRSVVSKQCTLEGFVDAVSDRDGILLREIEPLGTVLARTENSVYRVIPLEAGSSRILIQGGRFFPEPTEVRFAGSGFGGSFLKLGWIGLGLRMEVLWDGQRIITSRIRAVQVQPPASIGIKPS